MHPALVLVHLAAAVFLLLWAVRMVRTGVERAFGGTLKRTLRRARGRRLPIAAAGAGLAITLQSATAVALLVTGFIASGYLAPAAGLAALIGADLGSAIVVRVLALDLSGLIPFLILPGAVMFLKSEGRTVRQVGRILLGIGFVLLSLTMIGEATEPLREARALPAIVGALRSDPITGFAVAAALALVLHSSVAALLLLVTFAARGLLPADLGLPMVLGANLGSGLIAVWLSRGMPGPARRPPLANLGVRAAIAILLLAVLRIVPPPPEWFGATAAAQLVNFHLAVNLLLVVIALPFTGALDRLTVRLLPAAAEPPGPVSVLDRTVLGQPRLAFASATRELLKMGERVEAMFQPVGALLERSTPEEVARIRAMDDEVNWRHSGIKLYLAEAMRAPLEGGDAMRGKALTDFAINLEHAGDIICKTLLSLAEEKADAGLEFSLEGRAEIAELHARVAANLQLALGVLLSDDLTSARQLVREKEAIRRLERESHDSHFARLRSGRAESIETSNLHLEVVRALKEINSLFATAAYPLLTESGDLMESRLAKPA